MEELVDFLTEEASKWIVQKRNEYSLKAAPLSAREKEALAKWFAPELIGTVRVITVPVIDNPPFYEKAEKMELFGLPDLGQMESLTLNDVIVVAQRYKPTPDSEAWLTLLFQALVRSSAFRILGVNKLVDFYVKEWLNNGFSLERISLEVVAEELSKRFESYPDIIYSVEDELKEYIKDLYRTQ